MLENTIYPGNKTKGIAAWAKSIDSDENRLFVQSLEASGKTPNLFSLLSWESAQIALKALSLLEENKNNIAQTAEALHAFEFISPRGKITFHSKTNTSLSPMYNARIIPTENGMCKVELNGIINNTAEEFETLADLELNTITSSWFNSYTCI